jgi:hypothetical protein
MAASRRVASCAHVSATASVLAQINSVTQLGAMESAYRVALLLAVSGDQRGSREECVIFGMLVNIPTPA